MAGAEFRITDAIDPEITKKLQTINAELIEANKNLASFVVKAAQKITLKVDNISDLERKQQLFSVAMQSANKEQERMIALQTQAKGIYQQVFDKLSSLIKSIDGLSEKMDAYTRNVNNASAALKENVTSSQQADSAMKKAGESAKLASKDYEAIVSTMREYDSVVTKSNLTAVKLKAKLDEVRSAMSSLKKEYTSGGITIDQYNSSMAELQRKELELRASIKQEVSLLRNHASIVVSASGSYYEMNAAVSELEKRFKSLDASQRKGAIGQQTLASIQKLKDELKSIDAQMGNYQRNVGNYASGWNGLQFATQQIARELPSLAISWNTFFLAISNNLPILADEIKKARVEYEDLVNSGQKGTPVWKQLLKSLLSWQTALVIGITLLSTHGDELIEWGKKIFNTREEIDYLKQLQDEFNASQLEGAKNAQTESVSLDVLYKATQNVSKSMNERLAAASKLQEVYPAYFANMSKEEILAGKAAESYARLSSNIIAAAKARAAQDKIVENSKKQLELEDKLAKAYDAEEKAQTRLNEAQKSYTENVKDVNIEAKQFLAETLKSRRSDLNEATKEVSNIRKELVAIDIENSRIASSINIQDLLYESKDDKGYKDYSSYLKDINERLTQLSIEEIKNRYERERVEIKVEFDKNMAEITGNSAKEIKLRKELNEKLERDIANSKFKESLEVENINLQNRLSAIKEGSQEELDVRLSLLENQKKMELSEASETGASILAIENKYKNEREKLLEEFASNQINLIASRYALQDLFNQEDVSKQIKELTQAYSEGIMNKKKYEDAVLRIQQDYAIKAANAAIESIETQLNVQNLSEEERLRLEEELSRAKIALSNEETQVILENDEKQKRSIQEKQKSIENYLNMASEILNNLSKLGSAIFERDIQEIEDKQEANEEAGEKELERIEQLEESGVITKEEAEAKKRAAEAKTEAKSEELERKKAAIQRKQAIWDKANQLAQAAIATALAITRALPNIPLSILVGAMGAVQIATIAATPIPKYAKGTDYHRGGLALVGDGGSPELIQTDRGAWITPDVPTLVDLPRGASVVPNVDVDKIINDNLFINVDKYQKDAQDKGIVVFSDKNDYDYRRLETKIDKLSKVMEKGFKSNEKQLKDAVYREYIRSKM